MNIARMRNTKAFTLIELIVVIVIMGILVAIGAFAYNAVIKSAKKSAVEKVAAQVAKTVQAQSAADQSTYATVLAATPAPWAGDIDANTTVTVTGTTFTVKKDNYCSTVDTASHDIGTALTAGAGAAC